MDERKRNAPVPSTRAAVAAFIADCRERAAAALEAEAKRLMSEAQKLREVT